MLRTKFFNTNRRISKLSDEEKLKALIIDQVYQKPEERKRNILNYYELDDEFNEDIIVVYKSVFENVIIVGIRGTASISDVITDIRLVFQQMTDIKTMDKADRFNYLHKKLLEIYIKYNKYGYKIKLAGHSLSGFEVMRLEDKEPDKVTESTAFNAGTPPLTIYNIPKDVKHIANPLDPISRGFINDPQTLLLYKNNLSPLNPFKNHTIKYFID